MFFIRSAVFIVLDGIALGVISFWALGVYKSEEAIQCNNTVAEANKYRTLVLVNIIIFMGYAVLCWLLTLLGLCLACMTKFFYDEHQRNQMKEKMAKIPLAKKAIEKTTKKKFEDYELKEKGDKCIICYCEFEDDDEIAELACSAKHIFHTECI